MLKIAVLCSGRGSNLKALIDNQEQGFLKATINLVISDNKDSLALKLAADKGIRAEYLLFDSERRKEFETSLISLLITNNIELVVLAGFRRLLSEDILDHFKVINIHPALLPNFPGLDVWENQVEYGVKLAGATVHFVDNGMDTGPIIIQGAVAVLESDSPKDLAGRILKIEHKILSQAVNWFAEGRLRQEGRMVILEKAPRISDEELIWPPLENNIGR